MDPFPAGEAAAVVAAALGLAAAVLGLAAAALGLAAAVEALAALDGLATAGLEGAAFGEDLAGLLSGGGVWLQPRVHRLPTTRVEATSVRTNFIECSFATATDACLKLPIFHLDSQFPAESVIER